jgi:abhydrolase domain-containing protein 12
LSNGFIYEYVAEFRLIFLHWVPWPLWAEYDIPEKYGLARMSPHGMTMLMIAFKTRNFRLNSTDGESLGVWHVLYVSAMMFRLIRVSGQLMDRPKSTYQALEPFPPLSKLDDSIFEASLRDRPTILYFHGNVRPPMQPCSITMEETDRQAANRAAPHRVRSYSAYSALDVNVLAIDYRGFGDSTGTPSEKGLIDDGRAIWDYVTEQGGEEVILMGQSLGTGVVAGLAGELANEGMSREVYEWWV